MVILRQIKHKTKLYRDFLSPIDDSNNIDSQMRYLLNINPGPMKW